MDNRSVWVSGPMASDVYSTGPSMNYNRLMSAKRYIDRVLPTYVNQSSPLQHVGNSPDIHPIVANTDLPHNGTYTIVGGSIPMHDGRQSGLNCWTLLPPDEGPLSSTSSDSVNMGADSNSVMTEAHTDDTGDKLPEVKSFQSDVNGIDDCNGEMQPLGDSSLCSVCGDVAAGFHCGAYVCEACKVNRLKYAAYILLDIIAVFCNFVFCGFDI